MQELRSLTNLMINMLLSSGHQLVRWILVLKIRSSTLDTFMQDRTYSIISSNKIKEALEWQISPNSKIKVVHQGIMWDNKTELGAKICRGIRRSKLTILSTWDSHPNQSIHSILFTASISLLLEYQEKAKSRLEVSTLSRSSVTGEIFDVRFWLT